MATTTSNLTTAAHPAVRPTRSEPRGSLRRGNLIPTTVLVLGAIYTLIPVAWVVVASTKSPAELFSTFTFAPGSGLWQNLVDLSTYEDGQYWQWTLNSLVFAGGGAAASTVISAAAGYSLARYRFPGRGAVFTVLLAGVLLPQITLAIPQYFMVSAIGLANTYWSVLLPSMIYPFGIYLACLYAQASIPEEMIEAARIDGASEFSIFYRIAMPIMMPGLVTVFMLQFIGIWNNFLLPFMMLSDESKFPLTTGLYLLLNRGTGAPALYTLAIVGALVSIIPLVALMLFLQRFWRLDLISGGVKG